MSYRMAEAENVKLKDRISNFKVTAGNAIESCVASGSALGN